MHGSRLTVMPRMRLAAVAAAAAATALAAGDRLVGDPRLGRRDPRLLPEERGHAARDDTATLSRLDTTTAPRLDPDAQTVEIGGTAELPPAPTEPVELVVLAIIAIRMPLLVPAIEKTGYPVPSSPTQHFGRVPSFVPLKC